jgi:hypothetical protein
VSALIAFLNARLDEDEAGARTPDCDCGYLARVLREVEAKRAILAEHFILTNEDRSEAYEEFSVVPWGAKGGAGDQGSGCVTCHYYGMGGVKGYGICRTVRLLAAVYSDHPDYRQEWKS